MQKIISFTIFLWTYIVNLKVSYIHPAGLNAIYFYYFWSDIVILQELQVRLWDIQLLKFLFISWLQLLLAFKKYKYVCIYACLRNIKLIINYNPNMFRINTLKCISACPETIHIIKNLNYQLFNILPIYLLRIYFSR